MWQFWKNETKGKDVELVWRRTGEAAALGCVLVCQSATEALRNGATYGLQEFSLAYPGSRPGLAQRASGTGSFWGWRFVRPIS